jgi:transcription elongation GreA/GreB family factor
MSRAFTKENDELPEVLPELKVSTAPNYVTPKGLAEIDACIERLTHVLEHPHSDAEKARAARDLRYWTSRRATARIVEPPHGTHTVAFGSRITVRRDNRPPECVQIVGEDEADPNEGLWAYTAPLAHALIGAVPGEEIIVDTRDPPIELEVLTVDNG